MERGSYLGKGDTVRSSQENDCTESIDVKGSMCNALGLACYIAWSFLFWNGPLLMVGSLSVTAADGAFIAQGIATVLASGLLALIVCRNSRRFSRTTDRKSVV